MRNTPIPSQNHNNIASDNNFAVYINVLLRRWRTLATLFAAIFSIVLFYAFTEKLLYEASATIYVKDDLAYKTELLSELAARLSTNNPLDSEIEFLKSRSNAEAVVKRLHLDWKITPKEGKAECKLLEFTSKSSNPVYDLVTIENAAYRISTPDGKEIGIGQIGQLFKKDGLTLFVSEFKGASGNSCRLQILPVAVVAEQIRAGIRVAEIRKGTNVIRISYSSPSPQLSFDIVNTLVFSYLERSIEFKTTEADRAVAFVEEQLDAVRQDLEKSEAQLQAYKTDNGVVKLDMQADALIKQYSEAEKDLTRISVEKKQIEFAMDSLYDSAKKGITYSSSDQFVAILAGKLAEKEIQKQSLLNEFTKDHPDVKALQQQINENLQKIKSTYQSNVNNLQKRERELSKKLGEYDARLNKMPIAERDLARFMRVAKVNADVYSMLLHKHEEARIARALTISNIKILDPAIKPDRPVKSEKKKILVLGLLIACIASVGVAFFQDYLDKSIKDGGEASRILRWPVLAFIPNLHFSGSEVDIQCKIAPDSLFSEVFRGLRTTLLYSPEGRNKKVFIVTSPLSGAGKSAVSANLAIIIAQTGAKTVLIDCNLRNPKQHLIFNQSKTPGLPAILTDKNSIDEVVKNSGIRGLDIVCTDTPPANPTELLGSVQMDAFLEEMKERYDFIIIDAPSVLGVSDTPVLATSSCDGVILLIEPGHVSVKAAEKTRELLLTVDAPVTGIVINYRSCASTPVWGEKHDYLHAAKDRSIESSFSGSGLLAGISLPKSSGFWLFAASLIASSAIAWFVVSKDKFSLFSQTAPKQPAGTVSAPLNTTPSVVNVPPPQPSELSSLPAPTAAPLSSTQTPAVSPVQSPVTVPPSKLPPKAVPEAIHVAPPVAKAPLVESAKTASTLSAPVPKTTLKPKPEPVVAAPQKAAQQPEPAKAKPAPKVAAPLVKSEHPPSKPKVGVHEPIKSAPSATSVPKIILPPKELPDFIPTSKRDVSYSKDNQGWERYFSGTTEFRVLRDKDKTIKSIQIMDLGIAGLSTEFLDNAIRQLAEGRPFTLSAREKKGGFTIEKGGYSDNLKATYYRDNSGTKLKGVSFNWKW